MSSHLPVVSARRLSLLPILLALAACLAGLAPGLLAQTAHFSGAVQTLGSGFSGPEGVAVDGSGNVFVADTYNFAVKEIVAAGGYTTVLTLGSGFNIPRGVAVDGSGNVFVADTYNNAVKEIVAAGGYTTVNNLGGSGDPGGVAVDGSGNVFVADNYNNAVKEIMAGTGGAVPGTVNASSTVNPIGSGFSGPEGVAVDGSGNVFVADFYNKAVKEIVAGTGGAVAGTVNANSAVSLVSSGFDELYSVAVDGSGNVFVADTVNSALKEIVAAGGYTTVNTLDSGFIEPVGIAVDGSGNVFVTDLGQNAVKEIVAGTGGAGPGTVNASSTVNQVGSGFRLPQGVAVDGSGNIFVADEGNNAVKEIVAAGGYATVNTLGSGFNEPTGVAVDGSGNVFVADLGQNAVKEIVAAGGYTTVNTLGSGFSYPRGVAVDGSGNVFVAEPFNSEVKEIMAAGGYAAVLTLGGGFFDPFGVAVDGSGNVFVADLGNNAVKKLDYADPPSLSFASTNVGSTSSDSPQTVTVSNIGNADLTFPMLAGNNPSIATGFTLDGATTCPQLSPASAAGTLAAGTSCVFAVDFIPAVSGPNSGSLVLTDDNLNAVAPGYATQSIGLSGTGLPNTPTVTWPMASVITYGRALGASTLTGGSAAFGSTAVTGPFAFTNPTLVPTAGMQSESVTFTPTSSAYSPVTNTVSVQVNQASTMVSVLPTASAINIGQTLASSTLSGGTAVSTITGATVAGTFTFTNPTTPTATASQSVTFTPNDTTDYLGTSTSVTVTVNVPLPSLGISPAGINFGTVYQGSITTKTVTITNTGSAAVTIGNPLIAIVHGGSSKEFVTVDLCPKSLAAGKSCIMTVTFLAGPYYTPQTATLMISDNAAGSPQSVPLTATAINPVAQFSSSSLNLGTVKVGSSATKTLTVTSAGGTALSISSVSVSGANPGDFTQINTCASQTLNPKGVCSITVTFKPTLKGTRTAKLLVTDNAINSPQQISLSGGRDN